MSGLVAALGEASSTDLDPLLQEVDFRGVDPKKEGKENGGLTVFPESPRVKNQPFTTALDGYLLLTKKGEILLGDMGEQVLSRGLKQEGSSSLQEMEGEFALAVKGQGNHYLLARDPLGVKPLYSCKKEETLYLAPEIKALLHLQRPIKEVPPGCYYETGKGWVQYYQPPRGGTETSLSLEEVQEKIQKTLAQSVEEKTREIKDLGIYLSGGLDSSIIAALTARQNQGPIATYTVGIEGSRDIQYADQVARDLQAKHHVYPYDLPEMLEVLPDVIYHLESFDCAYVRSAIPNFLAARMAAADGRQVMLTGEGSDELFAGYSYLKTLSSPQEIQAELHSFLKNLSRTGLQRVDRMNSAHGLDYRVPFLKPALVELAQEIPLNWKLYPEGDLPRDKWILRRAYEEMLGSPIAWRKKEQFDEGSGSGNLLASVAQEEISDEDFVREAEEAPTLVRNKEELYYYRIFREFFPEDILPLVGRWTKTH